MKRFCVHAFLVCLSVQFFSVHSYGQVTLPKYYCMDISDTKMDGDGSPTNGVNYAELNSVSSSSDIKLTFLEGLIPGKKLQGPTDGTSTTPASNAFLGISNDELWGTASNSGSTDTRFILDMADPDLTDISLSDYQGNFKMIGKEGPCDIDFNATYCAQINNFQFNIAMSESSTGVITGTVQKYPAGPISTFTGTLSSGGLKLTAVTSASENLALEFSKTGVKGTYQAGTAPVRVVKGIRDPIGTAGCSNIRINGEDGAYYYANPTIVGDSIYMGSGSGANHPLRSTNAIVKIHKTTMATQWRKNLGSGEVRGSLVLDSSDKVYAVVQEGRTRDLTQWDPQGNFATATWKLFKFSNPAPPASPSVLWSRQILFASSNTPSQGQITPAIATVTTSTGTEERIFVGGDKVRAYSTAGTERWQYTGPTSCASTYYSVGSPIITAGGTLVVTSSCGIQGLNASTGAEVWSIGATSSTGEFFGSPQFARSGSTVLGVYIPFDDDLYCVDPDTGHNCSGWAGSAGTTPVACDITPTSLEAAPIRGGPLLDSSGNIFIGTKASSDDLGADGMMKIAANCTSITPMEEIVSGSDLYPTGVLNSNNQWIVANENRTTQYKTVNVFNLSVSPPALVTSYDLEGDPGFPSLRLFNDGANDRLLVPTEGGSPGFIPGALYSILQSYNYDTSAQNSTARGSNTNNGQ